MFDESKYIANYTKENYDIVKFYVPKGCKGEIKSLAENEGLSLSQFIIRTLEDTHFIDLHTKREPEQP